MEIGDATHPVIEGFDEDIVEIHEMIYQETSIQNLITSTFTLNLSIENIKDYTSHVILCPKNAEAEIINSLIVAQIEGVNQVSTH
jgi:hypothetical protein